MKIKVLSIQDVEPKFHHSTHCSYLEIKVDMTDANYRDLINTLCEYVGEKTILQIIKDGAPETFQQALGELR